MASAGEIVGLYRAMQRSARKFANYNVREYAKRKLREAFHENAGLKGEEAAAALAKAKTEAEVMKRQVEVYKMFGSAQKSVVELTGRNGVKKP